MTPTPDKIDTSTLGRMDLASGKSAPAPFEECVSTFSRTNSTAVPAILVWQSAEQLQRIEDKLDQLLTHAALSHKDGSK